MRIRSPDAVAVALLVAAGIGGLALWPRLPAELAVHFDASGTPDNYVSKPLGVVLAPAVGLLAVAFVRLSVRVDPTADRRVVDAAVLSLGGIVAYVQALVYAYNLGYRFSMAVALAPVFAATAALVGYALVREGV